MAATTGFSEYLRQAVSVDDSGYYHYWLAFALAFDGAAEEAATVLRQAREKRGDAETVVEILEELDKLGAVYGGGGRQGLQGCGRLYTNRHFFHDGL